MELTADNGTVQNLWVGIKGQTSNVDVIMGTDYRPPSQDDDTNELFFEELRDDIPRGSQRPELQNHDCKNDRLPADPDTVKDLLLQLDAYKSIVSDGTHPRILKATADAITKPLLMIFEQSWESAEVQLTES
ncbi:hypothetical protein TURU_099847 [Turdus rufiventris]|nr:hypothetical protein TURU_099847 [Turdus rufiventris]